MSEFERLLALGEELFNKGEFFEAHERLEEGWHKAGGMERHCLQGLIQICAGFHKAKTEPRATAGALYLLERGLEKVRACQDLLGFDVTEGLAIDLAPSIAALRAGRPPAEADVPALRFKPD